MAYYLLIKILNIRGVVRLDVEPFSSSGVDLIDCAVASDNEVSGG